MPDHWTHEEAVEEEQWYEDHMPPCPACGGPSEPLGALGGLHHYRCQNCGIGYHQTKEKSEDS